MWEGQATPRRAQIFAGVTLAVLGAPFFVLGAFGTVTGIVRGASLALLATGAVAWLVGAIGVTLAYRLVLGRGVRQGGGVMSPLAFRIGAILFMALAAFLSFQVFAQKDLRAIVGVVMSLFIAFLFWVAARHRAAMRHVD